MLRSRVLRVLCDLIKDVSPCYMYVSIDSVDWDDIMLRPCGTAPGNVVVRSLLRATIVIRKPTIDPKTMYSPMFTRHIWFS